MMEDSDAPELSSPSLKRVHNESNAVFLPGSAGIFKFLDNIGVRVKEERSETRFDLHVWIQMKIKIGEHEHQEYRSKRIATLMFGIKTR